MAYEHLQQIVDCEGEIRIQKHRHLNSLVQVIFDRDIVVESDPTLDEIADALEDADERAGRYICENW